MEILAENQFAITKSLYMEGMLRISRDGYGKTARRAILIILGLWVLFFLYALTVKADLSQTFGILLVIAAAGLWLCAGMPRSNARRLWKALEAKYGCDLRRTICFYLDHLEIRGEGLEKHIFYQEIEQILFSRRLLILICRDKTGVLAALNCFTKGNANDVKALIDSAKDKE